MVAAAAASTLRIGELALAVLAGVVVALLIEGSGAFDGLTVPALVIWLQWPVLVVLLPIGLRKLRRQLVPGALAGLWLATCILADYHRHLLPESGEGRQLVAARVLSIPERRGDELRFIAEIWPARSTAGTPGAEPQEPRWPLRARLLWKRAPRVQVGDRWQLPVSLMALTRARNPGQGWFDRQALRAGLHAGGAVLDSRLVQKLETAPPSIDALRAWLSAAIRARVAERDSAALLAALAVGDTQYVSREQWRVFNAVGITHLIAISGLHVTLFSLLTAAAARRLWALLPCLWRRVRREHCAALVGVGAACAYALLSGFSVPAQRTLIMLASWHALRCAARPAAVAPALAVALLCVLALDPLAPLGAGFWLSFAAVAVLMHAMAPRALVAADGAGRMQTLLHAAAELWRTQWRVALGLLPVTLAVFGSASIAGLFVNLLAIPLFSFALVPLILLSLPLLPLWPAAADPMLRLAAWLAVQLMPWLTRVADWDFALWRMHSPVWAVLLSVPAVWMLLLPGRWFLRGSACCALLPLLWPRVAAIAPGEFTATVLDVGRGQAILLRTAHHALLYDDGEHWGSDGAITRDVLLPALRAARLQRLDRLLMPRLDNDRGAGLVLLAAELRVSRWQAAGEVRDLPPEFAPCAAGESWDWDGVRFESLLDGECVLRVSVPDASAADGGRARPARATLLIAAELDRDAQRRLLDAGLAPSDAVIVPRHAAATADLPAFRDASAARWAIVTQSRRGAASASVQGTLAAWRGAGAQLWVTGVDGALNIRASARGLLAAPAGD
jgi:competence protein ComEC